MDIQLSKYWLLTSPHTEDPSCLYPMLCDSFATLSNHVSPFVQQFRKVLSLYDSQIYDYIISVEDLNHIHVYLEFSVPFNFYCCLDLLENWNIQIIPAEDKRIQAAKDYVRKSGYWTQKIPELPSVYASESPKWRKWQLSVIHSLDFQNDRQILFVYDKEGNHGKSFLASWFACRRRATYLPATLKTSRDLIRVALDRPSRCYFVDFPKCVTRTSIPQIFAAVESIKNGHVYDDRYEYRDLFIDHPKVCVFGNFNPDRSLLSNDRWVIKDL